MSTLPRTRSLGGADTSSLTRNFRQERNRPASLCEASWNKVDPSHPGTLSDKLRRTPSQANNLCTTVPTSIVNRTLGGRHAPTRSSLRHSRMAVLARNPTGTPRRWSTPARLSRVGSLVIYAHILVGVIGILLALWLGHWVPSMPFKELTHYPGAAIVTSGLTASLLLHCLPKTRKKVAQILKICLVLLLVASLLSCACVCVFDSLHLINLAPMECRTRNDVIIHPASGEPLAEILKPLSGDSEGSSSWSLKAPERLRSPEEEVEGSGDVRGGGQFVDDEGYGEGEGGGGEGEGGGEEGGGGGGRRGGRGGEFPVKEYLELETTPPLTSFEPQINEDIYVNVSSCLCYRRKGEWRVVMNYPKLSCDEVKNVLPIFLVASCVVTVAGGVLSVVLLYLLWPFKARSYTAYASNRLSESKPFIFKSNFKSTPIKQTNIATPPNGNHLYR